MSLPPKNGAAAASSYDQSVDGLVEDQSLADVLANALRHAVGGEGSESDQGPGSGAGDRSGAMSTGGFASAVNAFLAD